MTTVESKAVILRCIVLDTVIFWVTLPVNIYREIKGSGWKWRRLFYWNPRHILAAKIIHKALNKMITCCESIIRQDNLETSPQSSETLEDGRVFSTLGGLFPTVHSRETAGPLPPLLSFLLHHCLFPDYTLPWGRDGDIREGYCIVAWKLDKNLNLSLSFSLMPMNSRSTEQGRESH